MDIDIFIVRKGASNMKNPTLDMQVTLNTKGGIGLFIMEQDTSSVGSRHGQSTPFVSLLDEKTVQAINDEPDIEKIKKGPDHEASNSDFTGIPALVTLPHGTGHKLWSSTPFSEIEDIKSLPVTDEVKLSVLLHPTVKTEKNTGDILKPTMPAPADRQEDPVAGTVKSTFTETSKFIQSQPVMQHPSGENSPISLDLRKKSLPSFDEAKLFHLSTRTKNTTESPSESEMKQLIPQTEGIADRAYQPREGKAVYKMTSVSATEQKASRKMDQSAANQTSVTPNIRARNDVKSAIPLTTHVAGHADQTQTNDTVRGGVSATLLGATVADTPLLRADSSSGDHLTNHLRSTKSEHRTEAGSMDRMAEALRQKNDKSVADSIFSDLRRMTVSPLDNRTNTTVQKEGQYIAIGTQKPIVTINEKGTAMGPAVSEDSNKVGLIEKAVFMKSSAAGTNATDKDDQQIWNALPDRHHRTTNRDEFPLRTEMTNILPTQGTRSSTTGPAGINTQAVIDQILDAKQSLNNGFGRVRITLDPPNLGTVNLEIVVRKERVEVVITADNSGVQQALQSRADDIRTALQRQDLKIETFQILLQENTGNQQQANSGATFGQRQEHQTRQTLMDDSIAVQPLIRPIRESETARGLVSIFV